MLRGSLLLLSILALNLFAVESKNLYNSCKFCHGKHGEKTYMNKVEPINRFSYDELHVILRAYKKGEIDQFGLGKLMQGQLKNLSEDNIEQVSKYIADFK